MRETVFERGIGDPRYRVFAAHQFTPLVNSNSVFY